MAFYLVRKTVTREHTIVSGPRGGLTLSRDADHLRRATPSFSADAVLCVFGIPFPRVK
jgi:hypothetical protein